jgi:hypothetical protein
MLWAMNPTESPPLSQEEFSRAMAVRMAKIHAVCDRLHAMNREILEIMARIEAKWAAEASRNPPPPPA